MRFLVNRMKEKKLALPVLLITVILMAVTFLIPVQNLNSGIIPSSHLYIDSAAYSFVSQNGMIYAVDESCTRLVCLTRTKQVEYIIQNDPFGTNGGITDVTFDENNNIYVHFMATRIDAYFTDYESICQYDSKGRFVKELYRIDYSASQNPPNRNPGINGIRYSKGAIRFALKTHDSLSFLELNVNTGETKTLYFSDKSPDEISSYKSIRFMYDGGYVFSMRTGEVGIGTSDAHETVFKKFEYDIDKGGILPFSVEGGSGEIYVNDQASNSILRLSRDGTISTVISSEDFSRNGFNSADTYLGPISVSNGIVTGTADGIIWIMTPDGGLEILKEGVNVPLRIIFPEYIRLLTGALSIALILICIFYLFDIILKWRISLFVKQLILVLPTFLVMMYLILQFIYSNMSVLLVEEIKQRTLTYVSTTAERFSGDEIAGLTSLTSLSSPEFKHVLETQQSILSGNSDEWNKIYYSALYVCRGNQMRYLSISNGSMVNLSLYSLIDESSSEWQAFYSGKPFVASIQDIEGEWVYAQSPIYDSNGNIVAVYEIGADMANFREQSQALIDSTVNRILMFMPVVVLCVCIVTYLTIRYLRKTKRAVEQIAAGDFSVRVGNMPRDEIGDIGHGVNTMAENLLASFSNNEQLKDVYFKFVPIQFMHMLGKSNITEIKLGDGLSMDMTILFCDIRSFSLNSEMMTAKENFSFVNGFLGIAGPTIRKYSGFVDKYIGDAVMALFLDADCAVKAGIELYRELVVNPESAVTIGRDRINIGIGVHSGMAMLGIIGENERLSSTVISNNVNLTSRLESLTKLYNTGMIISRDTLDRLKDSTAFSMRFLGMIQVAGVNEVKALFEILDALDEKRKSSRLKTRELFESGVRQYHFGNLKASLESFEQVREQDTDDTAVNLYIEYIKNKLDSGDFDHNVFRFTRK